MDRQAQLEMFIAQHGTTRLPPRGRARKLKTAVVDNGTSCQSCRSPVRNRIVLRTNSTATDRGVYLSCPCGRLTFSPSEGKTRYRLEAF